MAGLAAPAAGGGAWLLSSAIQGLVAFLLLFLPAIMGRASAAVLVAVGLGQWLVLRQEGRQAGWWLPAYALSWGLGLAAFGAILSTPVPGAQLGALFGAITGAALVWILGGKGGERRVPRDV